MPCRLFGLCCWCHNSSHTSSWEPWFLHEYTFGKMPCNWGNKLPHSVHKGLSHFWVANCRFGISLLSLLPSFSNLHKHLVTSLSHFFAPSIASPTHACSLCFINSLSLQPLSYQLWLMYLCNVFVYCQNYFEWSERATLLWAASRLQWLFEVTFVGDFCMNNAYYRV